MTLKNGKPNPLNYFNLRKVTFPVCYFEYLTFDKCNDSTFKDIELWINQNLSGRFYIGKSIILDSTNTIVYNIKIGFEQAKELSYFVLACPIINQLTNRK